VESELGCLLLAAMLSSRLPPIVPQPRLGTQHAGCARARHGRRVAHGQATGVVELGRARSSRAAARRQGPAASARPARRPTGSACAANPRAPATSRRPRRRVVTAQVVQRAPVVGQAAAAQQAAVSRAISRTSAPMTRRTSRLPRDRRSRCRRRSAPCDTASPAAPPPAARVVVGAAEQHVARFRRGERGGIGDRCNQRRDGHGECASCARRCAASASALGRPRSAAVTPSISRGCAARRRPGRSAPTGRCPPAPA